MSNKFENTEVTPRATVSRRECLATLAAGMTALGMPAYAQEAPDPGPDLEKAKKEGTLIVVHGDAEADMAQLLNAFTAKTGLSVSQQRLLPGAALPKIQAEFQSGVREIDVFMPSDFGIMERLKAENKIDRYFSKEITAFGPAYRSQTPGYWTAYYMTANPIMYDARFVKPDAAPKDYMDLLDPKWTGQIGFQNAASGAQYVWWYVVKDVVPKDYWTRLAAVRPRAYSSSTQMVANINRGDLKIGGRVSDYMTIQAARQGTPLSVVHPPQGTAVHLTVAGILAKSQRPNLARAFIDYLLSKEGQTKWTEIQGCYSARQDVPPVGGKPPISSLKILVPQDLQDFMSPERNAEFVALWNKITGL